MASKEKGKMACSKILGQRTTKVIKALDETCGKTQRERGNGSHM